MRKEMGRPRLKVNLILMKKFRREGLGLRTVERHYYSETKQEVSFVTLRRRLMEAELTLQEGNNGTQGGIPK